MRTWRKISVVETITVLIGQLPQTVWVSGWCFCWCISFPWYSEKTAIVMGNYSPVQEVTHPIWRDWSPRLAQASRILRKYKFAPQGFLILFNFWIQTIPFGCSFIFSPICVPLKLPFWKLIFRMGFGRANGAAVGRVCLLHREGYERGQDDRFQEQVQERKKRTTYTLPYVSPLSCSLAQLGGSECSAYFSPKPLLFHHVLHFRQKCNLHLSDSPAPKFGPLSRYGCSEMTTLIFYG